MTDEWRPVFDAYEPSLKQAVELAAQFVAKVKANPTSPYAVWLTLVGVCGCGKTMLARQVYEACLSSNPGAASLWIAGNGIYRESNRRPRCVWLTATQFADRLRGGEFDLPEYLAHDFLVAIDDVGASRDTTAFIAEALYRLCNVRLGKWTIFTSNLSLAEIAKQIDERVASRMIRDGNICHRIMAGDYALKGRKS